MHRPLIITCAFVSLTAGLMWLQPQRPPQPLFASSAELVATQRFVVDAQTKSLILAAARPTEDFREPLIIGMGATNGKASSGVGAQGLPVEVTRRMAFSGVRPVPRPDTGPVVREPVLETPEPGEIVPATVEPSEPEFQMPTQPIRVATAIAASAKDQGAPVQRDPGAPLFAEFAARHTRLLTATGMDEDGRLQPTLRSLAANTRTLPVGGEITSPVLVGELQLEARAGVPTTSEQSQGMSRDTLSLITRFENSPSTQPIVGAPSASGELPVLDFTPEGDTALRAKIADAPTQAVHTVRLGDSLVTLALRYYGDADKAQILHEANRRHLPADGVPRLGQILRIPDIGDL